MFIYKRKGLTPPKLFIASISGWGMDKKLLVLAVLAFVLAAWPAFVYDVPIVQTDGASHYVYAKTFKESGLDAVNPRYNWYGSAERFVNEYPPLSPVVLGFLMYLFDDIMLINGLYGALFAVLGVVFLYLFVKEISNDQIALLASVLYLFNVRAYVGLFIGLYASSIAYYLTWTALYFALLAFKRGGLNWLWAFLVTGLISLTYPLHVLFVLLLQMFVWKGVYLQGKYKIKWPKIETTLKGWKWKDCYSIWGYVLGCMMFLFIVLYNFIFTSGHARASWVGEWINSLLAGNCATYPCIWKYFLLLDGPILVMAAIGGFLLAWYKNDWIMANIGTGALIIALIDLLFIPGDIVMLIYVYRVYTVLFVLFAILAAYCLKSCEYKDMVRVTIGIMLVIQVVKLGLFFMQVGPAMLPEDVGAVEYLQGIDGSILYVNNLAETDSFRSFKWIPVMVGNSNVEIVHKMPSRVDADYLYVGNGEYNGTPVYSQGTTRIYQI